MNGKGWSDILNSPLPTLWGIGLAASVGWLLTNLLVVGLVAILFLGLALTHSIASLWKRLGEYLGDRKFRREMEKRIPKLTAGEKQLLRDFVDRDTRVLPLYLHNDEVFSLVGWKILTMMSSVGIGYGPYPFGVNGVVWDLLQERPELLEE